MSDTSIFVIGVCVSVLCVAFVVASFFGLREAGRESDGRAASRRTS